MGIKDKVKNMATKMKTNLDKGVLSSIINAETSKHPKLRSNRTLAKIDSWSFRHSKAGKRFLKDI